MKNTLIFIMLFVSSALYSQERFWGLYPGWVVESSYEDENFYLLMGLDTISSGYENTPISYKINVNGELLNTYRYVSDSIVGFSMYSSKSFSIHDEYVLVSGVYKEILKDYIVDPILMYFNKTNYYLDSIKEFKQYFGDRSTQFKFHFENNEKVHLFGTLQYSLNWNTRLFYGVYDIVSGVFTYKDYSKPTTCKMTPYQVLPTTDGGYLLSCEQDMTYGYPEEVYACILKLDSEGNEMWRYVISDRIVETEFGPLESATYRPRVFNAPDGNYWIVWTDPKYIMATNMQSNDDCQVWIAKLTDNGDSCTLTGERGLMQEFDNPTLNWWVINDSYQAADGTMYILLQNFWDYNSALAKIHPNGVGAWFRTYKCYPEDVGSSYTYLKGITATSDGGFMLTGGYLNHGTEMFPDGMIASVVFKVDSCGCFDTEGCNDHCADTYAEYFVTMSEAGIYPNPASDKINVSFEYSGGETEFEYRIYGMDGKMVGRETTRQCFGSAQQASCGNNSLSIDVSDLPSAYYTIQFWGGGKIFTGKFVKE